MSGKGKSKLTQSSKSTSSSPHREFPAATSTFSGLVLVLVFSILFCGNTFASSISISLSGNVSLNLLKDNANPVFGTSTTTTANVTSDHYTGYTLTIQGANDSGKLENGNGSRYLTSISEAINENTFRTDDNYNDKWGFLPSKYNSADNNVYQPSPLHTNSTTIDVTNSPTSNNGNDYTLALGAKVTPNMALDSYGQTFVLAATGNGYDYYISYTDDLNDMPEDQHDTGVSVDQVQLSNVTPTKVGYIFVGWCTEKTTNNGTTCPGITYPVGYTIDLVGSSANHYDLHAIWDPISFDDAFAAASKTKVGGYYQMQDMDRSICSSIAVGELGTLVDTRTNPATTYAVAKYADGHCWMRQNLNLSLTANSAITAYNFATNSTFSYTPAYSTQSSTSTAWEQDARNGARSYGGDKDKYISGTDIAVTGSISTSGQPYEKIGILYNWAAATAQTGQQAVAITDNAEATTSICPKGWRLPTTSGDYSFSVVMGSYGLPMINQSQGYSGELRNPLNYNRFGYFYWSTGAPRSLGTNGNYWSSVVNSPNAAYSFSFDPSYFRPQHVSNKGDGLSIRCVAV